MSKWKCCLKEPPETGKKVLCQRSGDLYVAMRIKEFYVPMPFANHYFCDRLCKPETWCEIDFPEGLTGHLRVGIQGTDEILKLSEVEFTHPELFNEFATPLIGSIGTLKPPEKK